MVRCIECKTILADYLNLRVHVKKFHPEKLEVLAPKIKRKEGKCICQECKATYVNMYNLRKHIRQKHPDKLEEFAHIKKKYTCQYCSTEFDVLKQLKLHKKANHTITRRKVWNCPLCQYEAFSDDLLIHYRIEHSLNIHTEKLQFETFEAFQEWKYNMEKATYSSFVNQKGIRQYVNSKKIYYLCHRSGYYNKQEHRIRSLKTQGSNKINAYCPAEIELVIEESRCIVQFCSTHVGHQQIDLGHLTLSKVDRQNIAVKLAANVPLDTILDEIRVRVSNYQLERIHLLTKKDLHNIRKSLQSNHLNNNKIEMTNQASKLVKAIPESEDSQLSKNRERAINSWNKVMDLLKTAETNEEIYAVEKLMKPIEPTVLSIRQKNATTISLREMLDDKKN